MKHIEAMKLALEALEIYATAYSDGDEAITAIREALAEQPAQEPICDDDDDDVCVDCGMEHCECGEKDD